MPTLGNTAAPDTAVAYYRPRVKAVYVGQMPATGTLTNAHIYCDSSSVDPQEFSLGVFTANGSDYPDDFVDAAIATATSTPGWKTVTLTGSLTSGQHIWVGFVANPTTGDNTFRMYGLAAGASANVRQGNNVTGVYPDFPTPWANDDTTTQNQPAAYITYSSGSSAAISNPTPSGVIGTQNTATIGCTTDQSNGTIYAVASTTQGHITGVSAAQVIAAQTSSGGPAPFSSNVAVGTSTPSTGLTGLASGTLYYYAIAQVTSGGNSNVISGSFTTASSVRSASVTLHGASGSVLASTNVRVWTRTELSAAAADGSTSGLALTTTAGGVLNVTNLSIAAGAGWLTVKDDTDNNNCHNYPVTFA